MVIELEKQTLQTQSFLAFCIQARTHKINMYEKYVRVIFTPRIYIYIYEKENFLFTLTSINQNSF